MGDACSAASSRTVNEKVLPLPGVLSTPMAPPINSTSRADGQAQAGAAVLPRR